jgi:hypothetical protein
MMATVATIVAPAAALAWHPNDRLIGDIGFLISWLVLMGIDAMP